MIAPQFLKREHNALKRLFVELRRTRPRAHRKRREIIERIATELEIHTRIEDELFYPAIAELPDAGHIVSEARADHEAVDEVLRELQALDPGDAASNDKALELREIVIAHATDEELDVFPLAERLGPERLADIGTQLEARKRALLQQPAARRTAA
jgi:hemerythrin superfamily protein